MWMSLPAALYPTDADVGRFLQQVIDRVGELPGVRAAGVSSRLPLLPEGIDQVNPPYVENHPTATQGIPPLQMYEATDGGYFRAMGIPLVAGRTFDRIDGVQRSDEVVVSREIARQYWNDSTGAIALGKRLQRVPTGPWFTIVGVVGSIRDTSLSTPPAGTVYFAETGSAAVGRARRTVALVVRTAQDPAATMAEARQVVNQLDPTLPVYGQVSLQEVLDRSMGQLRFLMVVLGLAAGVTLLLSGIGLYGVIAYVVTLRTRELGLRVALGGQPGQVAAMVTGQGLRLALVGIAAGLIAFLLAGRFLRSLLFEVGPADPLSLVTVAIVLAGVAATASWLPARRAASVDPVEALRAD